MKKLFILLLVLGLTAPIFAQVQFQPRIAITNSLNTGGGGGNAYTFLGSTTKGGADSQTVVSDAVDTTGATFAVVGVCNYADTGATFVDSKGNTWTALNEYQTLYKVRMYSSVLTSVGSGHTFTFSGAGGATYPALAVMWFSGNAGSPIDQQNGFAGTLFTTIQPGSITPSQNNCLVVSACVFSVNPSTSAIDSGFSTPIQARNLGGGDIYIGLSYLKQTTAAAVNPTWNIGTANNNGAASIASFK